ncbi:baseplate assembly protein [Pasteurella atlantica]|uniref:baseplate assembly protein n=1 Tax=Pasteurella atlantica TaxID=2827233 RepID=UPI00276472E7|nr:baseplate J/gp47 family protein [Pasteurella atlantica]MDP8181131.1 baseplate J/gp47 family protein [Pasteurella atlantica]MDP8196449.1 baseplate J/gp47 family protein [Pasteurella atlantica]
MSNIINLAELQAPKIIEEIDFETLLESRKARFISLFETEQEKAFWTHRLEFESEPVVKLLEENAYLEMLLRARINNASKSVMLAYASESELDHLGALFNVKRLIIQQEDLTTESPTLAIYESDERFRKRIQLALESKTTAGSVGSYFYHTLTSSADIQDAYISTPSAGKVLVTVLATKKYGNADSSLLEKVKFYLNEEEIRPLTDTVIVEPAETVQYNITAQITLFHNALESVVLEEVNKKINKYKEKQYALGRDITKSGIFSALHQSGVQNVHLIEPANDIVITQQQVADCQQINITVSGRDE